MLRICTAQLNPTVGDLVGNRQRLAQVAQQAHQQGAHLLVTPELSLCGYYPGDWLDEPSFLHAMNTELEALRQQSTQWPELHCVIGAPTANPGPGKRLHNSLLVLHNGQWVQRYHKQLLPTYNVFDERRHFEPGPNTACVLTVAGTRVGFFICEDGWNDQGQDYVTNPFATLMQVQERPDVLVTLNASPSTLGKQALRHRLFAQASQRHQLPLVYVNQVGGQDSLVYDGASFAVEPQAGVVHQSPAFTEHVAHLGFENGRFTNLDGSSTAPTTHTLNDDATTERHAFYQAQIGLGLTDYMRRCGFSQVVVGSSGGIDSALTLALAAQALGPDRVTAITMPSAYSSTGSVSDSEALCHNLGIRLIHHPIIDLVQAHVQAFAHSTGAAPTGLALENLQARIRGTVLMAYSNQHGHLLLSTGNKSEISVGYCTLYGDTNGGLNLLGDLYKTEVFALAQHLNQQALDQGLTPPIPAAILSKPPSAELAPDQQDSDSLPPYDVLDEILKHFIEGERMPAADWTHTQHRMAQLQSTPEGLATVSRVWDLLLKTEYKRRQAPPIIHLRPRAFGTGRSMPIAAHRPAWSMS